MELNLIFDFDSLIPDYQKYEHLLLGNKFSTKLSTNKLKTKQDRKDERFPSAIFNVKMPIKVDFNSGKSGALILNGNLTCDFRDFTGHFYVKRVIQNNGANFNEMQGSECEIYACPTSGSADSIESFQTKMLRLVNDKEFVYNMGQYNDFIKIFEFYKKISNDLNNEMSFEIENISNPYYFLPIEVKDIDLDLNFAKEIFNAEGVLIGYKIDRSSYKDLRTEDKKKILFVANFELKANKNDLLKLNSFAKNNSLYLSGYPKIDDNNAKDAKPLNLLKSEAKLVDVKYFETEKYLVNVDDNRSEIYFVDKKNQEYSQEIQDLLLEEGDENYEYFGLEEKPKKQIHEVKIGSHQEEREREIPKFKKESRIFIIGEVDRLNLDKEKDNYVNLYDFGQKIKIQSIEDSLKLIHQGKTGEAQYLLELLIGDKPLPNDDRDQEMENPDYEEYLKDLNSSQQQAFKMAIDGNPVSLIKGPPGTGKTQVISSIVKYIVKKRKEKVLISSQTHIAIDNVLDRVCLGSDMVIPKRISRRKNKYSTEYIDETLYEIWTKNIDSFLNSLKNETLADKMIANLQNFKGLPTFNFSVNFDDYSVIGATTTTAATAGKRGYTVLEGVDWLIIDEVSKSPITEVLRYLPYVKRIIMVGDDYQLAPLLEFTKDVVKDLPSYNEELFDRLESTYQKSVFADIYDKALSTNRVVQLNENYRSLKSVLEIYNIFYQGKLLNLREKVNPKSVTFTDNSWNDADAFFVEVLNGSEVTKGTSRYNVEEIEAMKNILEELIKSTVNPNKVRVAAIFPYAAQISTFTREVRKLINQAKKTFASFEYDTVDAFQGREADIVLVSTVVTDQSKRNFLNDFRRINVSVSRARDKLIIFGNSTTLAKIEMRTGQGTKNKYFRDIIQTIETSDRGMMIKFNKGELKYETKSTSDIKLA